MLIIISRKEIVMSIEQALNKLDSNINLLFLVADAVDLKDSPYGEKLPSALFEIYYNLIEAKQVIEEECLKNIAE